MNRTVKNLILAAGFAAVALTSTVAPAHADGPGISDQLIVPPIVDPPVPEDDPQAPVDEAAPAPAEDDPQDQGCFTGCDLPEQNAENPAEDADLDQGCFTGCDLPEQDAEDPAVESAAIPSQPEVRTPTRVDAGKVITGPEAEAQPEVAAEETGSAWIWLAAGTAFLVALAGAAYAARRRA